MTSSCRRLVVIVGPTGSGKTDLSIRLAEHYRAPILSTDSRQVFKGMPIGTAQPTEEQLARVEHYFIASLDITQEFNCGQFEIEALALLDHLFMKYETVIAVGGSGLYVRALCEGMDELPKADPRLRTELSERLRKEGLSVLAGELRKLDPVYYEKLDRNNPARVLRALEVCYQTGRPFSSFRTGVRRKRDFEIVKVGIDLPRDVLYERIDSRVDLMMEAGLEAEVRPLYPFRHLNSLQTVGYKELFAYIDGKCTRQEAVELIKRNSRRYAKRQLTWFRADSSVRWFSPERMEETIRYIDFAFHK